uniref:RING-type domain-containing protein n=1 Tax=Leersia perrieri TaxID=77586 RepID=A0A0D9WLR0_9ORYZ
MSSSRSFENILDHYFEIDLLRHRVNGVFRRSDSAGAAGENRSGGTPTMSPPVNQPAAVAVAEESLQFQLDDDDDGDDPTPPAAAWGLKTVDPPDDGSDCPICLDGGSEKKKTAAEEDVWVETPCPHKFHGRCLETWKKKAKSRTICPMCRRVLITPPATATATAAMTTAAADDVTVPEDATATRTDESFIMK